MLDDDDREAALAQRSDPVEKLLDFRGIEPGRRLVDHQEPRSGCQRTRKLEHPLLAVGERCGDDRSALIEPHEGKQLHRLLARSNMITPERGAVKDVLPSWNVVVDVKPGDDVGEHRQLLEQSNLLERAPETEPHSAVCRQTDEVDTVEDHAPGVGLVESAHQIEQSRFSGAVRADDREDRAGWNIERDIGHCTNAAEALAQTIRAKQERDRG